MPSIIQLLNSTLKATKELSTIKKHFILLLMKKFWPWDQKMMDNKLVKTENDLYKLIHYIE